MGSEKSLQYHDVEGSTPMVLAARTSAVDMALFLLDKGSDPDARGYSGRTALHYDIELNLPDLAAVRVHG